MPIELMTVDLDATLLNSKSEMSERNEKALKAAIDQGVRVVLATGKTRASSTALVARLGLTTPGIFLQGLAIYQPDGNITYQKTLEPEVARQVITFAEDRGYAIAAYSGSRILVRHAESWFNKLATDYHEPMPEAVGALQNILDDMPVNKVMVVKPGEPARINALRWQLERQLDGRGHLTQAMLPDMIEILPPGGSKGTALKVLLKQMGIDAANVLAIGDGENDIDMIQLAGIGVAVGNASDKLKAVADHVVASNDADGVAEAVERFVLEKSLEADKDESDAEETQASEPGAGK